MEQYPYWPSQRTDSLPLDSPEIPTTEGNDPSLHLLYPLQNQVLEHQFAKQTRSRLSINEINTNVLKHDFTSPTSTKSASPELYFDPSAFSERQDSNSDGSRSSNLSTQEDGQKLVNRRIQNRAAQRRFRERRDEQNKVLQGKLAELQEEHQKLSDELSQKSKDVGSLKTENEALKSEIENLRQRWRSILLLLKRPKSLQLLSMLVGGEEEPEDSGSGISDLDRYLRCLDALTLPNDKP
ncbi:uncharacterized protein N7496_001696 [Penicillium cataractarum]|uniref:BZIP domain-containing protein n=1 Tax=Penicillium cataractarum TaxID=2100454 RepID=A0A9W9VWL4_9EURO|nr:uncharacterized protein N7496_001696 [Penicillium cataractarum]KAJ5390628.1 hypothetical protein N7496_001696 [Penicillium cataractarum]